MEITTEQFVNSDSTRVYFSVHNDDWCLIQQSDAWNKIISFLSESEKRQLSYEEKMDLLEDKAITTKNRVDKVIEALSNNIIDMAEKGNDLESSNALSNKVKALAELVNARTQL
jgi:hypothetical protein|nr:MAG TPA: hypothetical protein [Caudoviricetes sp.]